MKLESNLRDKLRYLYWYVNKLARLELELTLQGCNLDESKFVHIHLSRSITSQLIFFIINEEISNNISRDGLESLFKQIGVGEDKENINSLFIENSSCEEYTRDLFVNQFNLILQNNFYDYQLSMWSSFELNISNLFNEYSDNYETLLEDSYYKKIMKFMIDKIVNDIELSTIQKDKLNEILVSKKNTFLKEFPKFISSDDKLNYIFKIIKSTYTRNINDDKRILHFIRSLRNTIHNNGIHNGKDIEVNVQSHIYKLKNGKIGLFDSDTNIVKLNFELLEIYSHIILALPRTS